MKARKDCKVAGQHLITESNKDDEFIYAGTTDHEGKGYLEQYINPLWKPAPKRAPKELKVEPIVVPDVPEKVAPVKKSKKKSWRSLSR